MDGANGPAFGGPVDKLRDTHQLHGWQSDGFREALNPSYVPAIASARTRQMPPRELNMTIGELPPVFDDRHITRLRRLIEYFARLQPSRINRQGECLRLLHAGHSIGQITGASGHDTSFAQCTAYRGRKTAKLKASDHAISNYPR
jgi:hypothetical protein